MPHKIGHVSFSATGNVRIAARIRKNHPEPQMDGGISGPGKTLITTDGGTGETRQGRAGKGHTGPGIAGGNHEVREMDESLDEN